MENKSGIFLILIIMISLALIMIVIQFASFPVSAYSYMDSSDDSYYYPNNNQEMIVYTDNYATSPKTHYVYISNNMFSPNSIEIRKGDTIIFKNIDSVKHTVTPDSSNEFLTKTLLPGESFSHVFQDAETLYYHCTIHPSMIGKIIVYETSYMSDDDYTKYQMKDKSYKKKVTYSHRNYYSGPFMVYYFYYRYYHQNRDRYRESYHDDDNYNYRDDEETPVNNPKIELQKSKPAINIMEYYR